jgi:uncharacterized protein
MKIRLEDIPKEGREVSFSENVPSPRELGPQVKKMDGPISARLSLARRGEKVFVKGEFDASLILYCSRCLEETSVTLASPLEMVFMPQPEDMAEEVVLAEDDLAITFYSEGEIDLSRAVLDELTLALPMAPLCSPECQGICPACGQSHTKDGCGCTEKSIDPRWAKLAQLKKED